MKKAAVMLAPGYEEGESLFVVDIIRRGGFECDSIGLDDKQVTGCNGITALADKVFNGSLEGYDLVVFPGGMPGAANLAANDELIAAVRKMASEGKLVASICAGPMSLDRAGLLTGRRFTCFPTRKDEIGKDGEWVDEVVVRDGNVITSQGPGTTLSFAHALVDALGGDGEALRNRMLYTKVCK